MIGHFLASGSNTVGVSSRSGLDFATIVGCSLFHFLWQGILIAAITWVALLLFRDRSAATQYLIACVGLTLMAAAPVLTFVSIVSSQPESQSDKRLNSSKFIAANTFSTIEYLNGANDIAATKSESKFNKYRSSAAVSDEPRMFVWLKQGIEKMFRSISNSAENLAPRIAALWFVGVVLLGVRLFSSWAGLQSIRKNCEPIENPWFEKTISSLQQQMKIRVDLCVKESSTVLNPLLIGWLQPLILLPTSLVTELSPDQMKAILAHELAHVRRGDFLVNLLQCVVETLLFFHPCVWWLSGRIRAERENCCDDIAAGVTGDRKGYAQALLLLEETRKQSNGFALYATGEGSLLRRIRRIAQARQQRRQHRSVPVAALICVLALVLFSPSASGIASVVWSTQEEDPMVLNQNIEVRVLDQEGNPVSDVHLHAGVWSGSGYKDDVVFPPNSTYVTDAKGVANVKLPFNYYIVRLWIRKDGFVPMFAAWEQADINNGDAPPKKFEVRMVPGTVVGGVVHDGVGNPVANAKVKLRGPGSDLGKRPRILGQLGVVETDAQGQWRFNNVPPGNRGPFSVDVEHESYLPQKSTVLQAVELRNLTAKISLFAGVQITGKVTDQNGEAVSDGLVIWGEDPYFESGSQEIELQLDGSYRTVPLPPGNKKVTVIAEGFAPETQTAEVKPGMVTIDFTLKPGKRLQIKAVDELGTPLAGAYFTPRKWRGGKSLYSHIHPTVKPTGVPYQANDEGVFEWDWAPDDEIEWMVSAKNYLAKIVVLTPGDEPHVVQLKKVPAIKGRIIYESSGKPAKFVKVTPIRYNFVATAKGQRLDGEAVVADSKGMYSIPLRQNGGFWRFEVSKKGYRSVLSKMISTGDVPSELNVQLVKSEPRVGRVVDVDGKPVARASIHRVSEIESLSMKSYQVQFRAPIAVTKSDGSFEYQQVTELATLVVLHDRGYAEVEIADKPSEDDLKIVIQPWAKLKGRVSLGGKPVANNSVSLRPLMHQPTISSLIDSSSSTKTDADGNFEFSKVGPHFCSVSALRFIDGSRYLVSAPLLPVPGEAMQMNIEFALEVSSSPLDPKVVELANLSNASFTLSKLDSWRRCLPDSIEVNGSDPQSYLDEIRKFEKRKDWNAVLAMNRSVEQVSGPLRKDGSFQTYVSEPGIYRLQLNVPGRPAWKQGDIYVASLVQHQELIQIRDNGTQLPPLKIDGVLPAGIGEQVPEFTLSTEQGSISSKQFRGKITLLDFWHPDSKTSIAANSTLASLASSVQSDDPLSIVSIKTGSSERSDAVRKFPEGLSNYVTSVALDESQSIALGQQLGVWFVPRAVVVDQQGKVCFSGSHDQAVERVREMLLGK
jgi:beta-lactamase regulating signal transducer with metallopeptidase domain